MFWREKLLSVVYSEPDDVINWILDQISIRHLFRDVLIHKYFWVSGIVTLVTARWTILGISNLNFRRIDG